MIRDWRFGDFGRLGGAQKAEDRIRKTEDGFPAGRDVRFAASLMVMMILPS